LDKFDDMGIENIDDIDIIEGTPSEEAYEEDTEEIEVVDKDTTDIRLVDALDFNAIDLGLSTPGVVVAETGTKVSRFPVERIKFTTSKKERISIILDKVIIVKSHYVEDMGSILCNGSLCCEQFGLPSVRYLFPIVHYEDTDRRGQLMSAQIELKVLAVGVDNYEELLTIMENKGPLSEFDIVVTCNDEQYQKCSYTEVGEAKWKKSKKARNYISERLKKDGKHITSCIGRTMTDAQIKKELGLDIAPGISDIDMDDIFGE